MKKISDFKNFVLLLEERGSSLAVRFVVKDITNLFKSGITGSFILPQDRNTSFEKYVYNIEDDFDDVEEDNEDLYENYDDIYFDEDDEEEDDEKQLLRYDFPDFPVYFWVELKLFHDTSLTRFRIDASAGAFDISVEITYNPEQDMNNPRFWNELNAELNVDVAHELEHLLQNYHGEFRNSQRYRSNFQYYMLPVEVPAQVAGFKRLYDLERKRNSDLQFEDLVRNWFLNRRYISRITRKSENTIIANIVNTAKQKYPSIK